MVIASNKANQVKNVSEYLKDWASSGWSSGGVSIISGGLRAFFAEMKSLLPSAWAASIGQGEVPQVVLLTAKLLHHSGGQLMV